jgi:drug/metabolite transporter (DMT)-like permease
MGLSRFARPLVVARRGGRRQVEQLRIRRAASNGRRPSAVAEALEFALADQAAYRKRMGAWDSPLLLLSGTALIWAGHSVVGKLAVGEIGPMTLTFLRWSLALGPICFAARRTLRADLSVLRKRWLYVGSLGALGYTAFNALFYLSAHYTAALNMSLIQACIPGLVLIGAALAYGARPTLQQGLGTLLTMTGVATIAAQGDFQRLAKFAFNFGDVLLFVACLFFAYFTLGLRSRPAVSGLGFLAGMALAALITSVPPFLWEVASGGFVWPTGKGFAVLVYAALGPAFLAQVLFMRGVELIGPGRAGVFVNLVPIFGAFLAVGLLGEPLHAYHIAALALVIGGILLAQHGPAIPPKTR